ncbi:MAG: hypothetical protein JWP85_1976 [Rhodoglobus sp.]|nr:hypothetical protein [Rhodoglobus sp.]
MTVPRWLIPVLSVITAVALAVAAAFIASSLTTDPAESDVPAAQAQTEMVPVLEPVPVGGDGLPLPDSDGDPETIDSSPSNGATEIVSPGTGDESDLGARTEARIDALDASEGLDDLGARDVLDSAGEGSPSAPSDPCAPEDGASVEGCPDGLHGALFALTEPEALRVFPRADPPVALAGSGGLVACPAAEGADGQLSFGVASTTPSVVTLRFWPADDPSAEQSVTIMGDPAEEAAWDAEIARYGGYPPGYGLFQHCGVLTGLRPNTSYESSALAIDIFDRIASASLEFDSRGAAVRPPMTIVPLGPSLVYVSVPTTGTGPVPWLRGWVVPHGEPADCSAFDSHAEVRRVLDENLVDVDAAWSAARNYEPSYNRRVTNVFSVPEGSTVVFCARWYDATAPSWSRDLPRDQVSAVVHSPDAWSPAVTVTGLSLAKPVDARAVRLSASTQLGVECGPRALLPETAAGPGAPLTLDALICAPGRSDSATAAPLGSGGNIVVTSRVGAVTRSTLLPLSRYGCLGDCPAPPMLTFQVLLPTVTIGTGLCGSSFGESCTPPTSEVALGTATVTVTWEQGSDSGQREWEVGESSYVVPDAPVSDHPQLDTFQYVSAALSADGFEGSASIPIRTDRHATYRVLIEGDCFTGAVPEPVDGETFALASGAQGADVSVAGLCPGEQYRVAVELTDDAGNRATYGYSEPHPRAWYGAQVDVPRNELEFSGTVEIRNISEGPRPWWTTGAIVAVGGTGAWDHYPEFPDDTCFARTELSTLGTFEGVVAQDRTVHISFRAFAITEGMYSGVDRDATCAWRDQTWNELRLEADVGYADFLRGVSFTGDLVPTWVAPGAPYDAEFEAVLTIRGSAP